MLPTPTSRCGYCSQLFPNSLIGWPACRGAVMDFHRLFLGITAHRRTGNRPHTDANSSHQSPSKLRSDTKGGSGHKRRPRGHCNAFDPVVRLTRYPIVYPYLFRVQTLPALFSASIAAMQSGSPQSAMHFRQSPPQSALSGSSALSSGLPHVWQPRPNHSRGC